MCVLTIFKQHEWKARNWEGGNLILKYDLSYTHKRRRQKGNEDKEWKKISSACETL